MEGMRDPMAAESLSWIVSQIGAREHYAVPRSFKLIGRLDSVYTDAYSAAGPWLRKVLPDRMFRIGSRYHRGLVGTPIHAMNLRSLRRRWLAILDGVEPGTVEAMYAYYLAEGREFAAWTARNLARRRDLDHARHAFFGFTNGSLEALQLLRDRGVFTILDQIDPGRLDQVAIDAERAKWPDWERATGQVPEVFYDRVRQEWETADRVLVNSNWSKGNVLRAGVAGDKVMVVPLVYEREATTPPEPHYNPSGRMKVLWLGQIGLRKGIPYLFESARALPTVDFVVAGTMLINDTVVRSAPANLTVEGKITRERAIELFLTSDVFVLPTLSDGFALTQLEAMAHGLPVIATDRCGEVVRDGVDGFIIEAGTSTGLTEKLALLDADRPRLRALSAAAIARSGDFGLERYARGVMAALSSP
jgi:glycosyltransferase involved in cell wall biosynthesis